MVDCSWVKEPRFITVCEVNRDDPVGCPFYGKECKSCDFDDYEQEPKELTQMGELDGDKVFICQYPHKR